MINFEALQAIVNDPPADILELYSRFCDAHSYTYGDITRIGKVYEENVTNPPDDVFVQVAKLSADGDAILATCFLGSTVEGVTTYASRLGIYLRASGGGQAELLRTTILGKQLGTHLAEAMGYDDYLVIRALSHTVTDINGTTAQVAVMPLVFPPGIQYHTASPGHYIEAGSTANVSILDTPVLRNPAARMRSNINTNGNNIRPSAWFYVTSSYDGAVLPMSVYITDDQCWATVNDRINVMQQARIKQAESDIDDVEDSIDATNTAVASLGEAYGAVVATVGALSVFGNSVKDVTERYTNLQQYIPRP